MNCYLCNKEDFIERKGSVRDNASLRILECTSCGLVMLSSFEHIHDKHYEQSGMHGTELPSIENWLIETASDDERRVEMLKQSIINKKVLDFGCGAAGFVHKAHTYTEDIAGVEPEQRVRDFWENDIVLYNSLDEAGFGYDLITAFHVIEHLPDPRDMLRELAKRLLDTGKLVIEVPSSQDALLTLYNNEAFQRFTYWSQHLFLFDQNTLDDLARQAGLEVVSIQQYQRYPLSNHLYWLSRNQPGGHRHWSFLDSSIMNEAYAATLAKIGKSDTLIAYFSKK